MGYIMSINYLDIITCMACIYNVYVLMHVSLNLHALNCLFIIKIPHQLWYYNLYCLVLLPGWHTVEAS